MRGSETRETARNEPVFANREQGRNECVVASLANSLEYLNNRNRLWINPARISFEALKQAVGWNSGGAPVGDDLARPLWAQRKKEHLAAHDIPVTTEVTADPVRATQALGDNCKVEIRVTGHAACLRAMARMDATRHVLGIAHDQRQEEEGGTVLETLLYDSATGDITGGAWTHGRRFTAFAIECPIQKGRPPRSEASANPGPGTPVQAPGVTRRRPRPQAGQRLLIPG